MDHVLYLDIETIPSQSPELAERIRAGIKPPGSIKKPESIATWMEENADAAVAEALAKTSFDPATGHICTIGYAIDNGDPVALHAATVDGEAAILEGFFAAIRPYHRYVIVGHNVGGFDLRFILCRAVVLGITVPPALPRDPKPWDKGVFDTMTAWAGARGSIGMDRLCEALGLPGKDGFDGSMVAAAWAAGEHDRIATYCADDVAKTRAVHRRFVAVGW